MDTAYAENEAGNTAAGNAPTRDTVDAVAQEVIGCCCCVRPDRDPKLFWELSETGECGRRHVECV